LYLDTRANADLKPYSGLPARFRILGQTASGQMIIRVDAKFTDIRWTPGS
jgi:hypothetical protein